jgi:nucleoside-diphosphate-sugar epimerase
MDLTHIDDAVQAVWLALTASSALSGRVYHITSGDPQLRREVLAAMFSGCGLSVRFKPVPRWLALLAAGCMETASRTLTAGRWEPPVTRYSVGALAFEQSLDISAARADLGFKPEGGVLEKLHETGKVWREANP